MQDRHGTILSMLLSNLKKMQSFLFVMMNILMMTLLVDSFNL